VPPLPAFHNVTVMRLAERTGFAHAIRKALAHVRTEYVVVIQHDLAFVKPVRFADIVGVMQADPDTFK